MFKHAACPAKTRVMQWRCLVWISLTAGLSSACIGKASSSAVSEPAPANEMSPRLDAPSKSAQSPALMPNQPAPGAPEGEHMALFLLIGQSNMEGEAKPEPQDLAENPGVYVLGFDTCGDRQWNQWS